MRESGQHKYKSVVADKDSLPLWTVSDQRKIQALLGKAIKDVEFSWKEGELAAWTCFHWREKKWSYWYVVKEISWDGFSTKMKTELACYWSEKNGYELDFGQTEENKSISQAWNVSI